MELEQIEWPEIQDLSTGIIKVVGVGGGGSNAVKNMYKQGVEHVSFAICNTDSQALSQSNIPVRIQLGDEGLGVGGNPEKGKQKALESIEKIQHLFDDNTQMAFITAGMGGGTGTGASPVIAKVAKDLGILTVGVVTLPFAFEKMVRIEKALYGIEELKKNVDALLVINNQRLMQIYSDCGTSVEAAFQKADDILSVACKSIAEIVTIEGTVNRDFHDVQTVMKDGGGAIMSVGRASGEHRIQKAMSAALNSPLLNNIEIEKAQRLLYVIYSCDDNPVMVSELEEVNCFMDTLSADIEVLWGLYKDNTLGDDVKVTIIATGFDKTRDAYMEEELQSQRERFAKLMNQYYGTPVRKPLKAKPVKEESVPEEIIAPVPVIEEQVEQEDEIEDQETKEPEETAKKTWLTRLGNYINDLVNTPY